MCIDGIVHVLDVSVAGLAEKIAALGVGGIGILHRLDPGNARLRDGPNDLGAAIGKLTRLRRLVRRAALAKHPIIRQLDRHLDKRIRAQLHRLDPIAAKVRKL